MDPSLITEPSQAPMAVPLLSDSAIRSPSSATIHVPSTCCRDCNFALEPTTVDLLRSIQMEQWSDSVKTKK